MLVPPNSIYYAFHDRVNLDHPAVAGLPIELRAKFKFVLCTDVLR